MFRTSLLVIIALTIFVGPQLAIAQSGSQTIEVNLAKSNFEFGDKYVFQRNGVLKTGGITSTALVIRQIPKIVTYSETYEVVVLVDGQEFYETHVREVQHAVYESVYEELSIDLPVVKGVWYGTNKYAIWLISTAGPRGIQLGVGTKYGNVVSGVVKYVSLGTLPPTGTYQVSTAVEN